MKLGVFARKESKLRQKDVALMMDSLSGSGNELYRIVPGGSVLEGTDMVLAVGGDGTFLSAAAVVGGSGVPVLGVNAGRLGFLSENAPSSVSTALLEGDYAVEQRSVVAVSSGSTLLSIWPCALNEICVHRTDAAMLGIDVCVNGVALPTYWADGIIVATSSGSTAYSLSAGGPIALPESKVLILSPIAPHNLNVRPLVLPDTSVVTLKFRSRSETVNLSVDNRSAVIPSDSSLEVRMAQFSLNRVRLRGADFIGALTSKLFWGEDMRNNESND